MTDTLNKTPLRLGDPGFYEAVCALDDALDRSEKESETTFAFMTPDYRGVMVVESVRARSIAVARYKFRRLVLNKHGIRAIPQMIYPVSP